MVRTAGDGEMERPPVVGSGVRRDEGVLRACSLYVDGVGDRLDVAQVYTERVQYRTGSGEWNV